MDPRTEQIARGMPLVEAVLDEWGYPNENRALRAYKESQVLFWLHNFQPSEIPDALQLLQKIQYRDDQFIRRAIELLSQELIRLLGGELDRMRFFPLGLSTSSSGGMYLYDFRKHLNLEERHFPGGYAESS